MLPPDKNTLSSEQLRRLAVRLATSVLVFIVGPAGAWDARGLNGLLSYILIYTILRFVIAEFSSKSGEKGAVRNYRFSPLILVLAGLTPQILPGWESQVVLVPILLGSYEGAYWSTFHGIREARRRITGQPRKDDIDRFQKWEVGATCSAAVLVMLAGDYAAPTAAILAIVAWIIPFDSITKQALESSIAVSTSDFNSEKAIFGNLTTGAYGMMLLIITNSMRIFSLHVGDIDTLALIVAISTLAGYVFKKWHEDEEKESMDNQNWVWGHKVVLMAIILMLAGHAFVSIYLFFIGYIVSTFASAGILRPLEIAIAGRLLEAEGDISGEGTIGLRERLKFTAQAKLVSILSLAWIILSEIHSEPTIELILSSTMVFAAICAMANIDFSRKTSRLLEA
jgi:hypothetical protein